MAEIGGDFGRAETIREKPSDFRLNKRDVQADCLGDGPHPLQNDLKETSGVIEAIRHGRKGELDCQRSPTRERAGNVVSPGEDFRDLAPLHRLNGGLSRIRMLAKAARTSDFPNDTSPNGL